jgi:hypothetical protein
MKIDRPKIDVDLFFSWRILRVDDGLEVVGNTISFVEFGESGRAKELHQNPAVGYSLLVDRGVWHTTVITELLDPMEGEVHRFKTENSEYVITKIK